MTITINSIYHLNESVTLPWHTSTKPRNPSGPMEFTYIAGHRDETRLLMTSIYHANITDDIPHADGAMPPPVAPLSQ